MDSYKSLFIENSLKIRSRRMKFLKISLTTLFWIVAITPWILCINLYNQVGKLKTKNLELSNYYQELSLGQEDKYKNSCHSNLENNDVKEDISASTNISSQLDNDSSTSSNIDDGIEMDSSTSLSIDSGIEMDSTTSLSIDSGIEMDSSTSSNIDSEIEMDSTISANISSDIQREQTSRNDIINNSNRFIDKNVYLTFDDGPSIYTDEILDMLGKYNVKATFFVIGKTDEDSLALYKRIVKEGHALGMHSYSHDYKVIYNSIEDFDKDFTKLRDLLYDTTGYLPNIYRFPGGSASLANKNQISDFIHYIEAKSVTYFDWNVVNGDATGEVLSKEQLVANVVSGVEMFHHSIVLMHDTITKEATVQSLEELIITLTSQGASLLALDYNVKPIQQIKIKP